MDISPGNGSDNAGGQDLVPIGHLGGLHWPQEGGPRQVTNPNPKKSKRSPGRREPFQGCILLLSDVVFFSSARCLQDFTTASHSRLHPCQRLRSQNNKACNMGNNIHSYFRAFSEGIPTKNVQCVIVSRDVQNHQG